MRIQVRLFAAAREAAGTEFLEVNASSGICVAELRTQIAEQCPPLQPQSAHLLVAVNDRYAADSQILSDGDAVCCFPPVSGG